MNKKMILVVISLINIGSVLNAAENKLEDVAAIREHNFKQFSESGKCEGCKFANGTDFRQAIANLRKIHGYKLAIDLQNATLIDANFSGSNLSEANLNGALCYGANFEGANLSRSLSIETNFDRACLKKAILSAGNFYKAQFNGANLQNAEIQPTGSMIYGPVNMTHLANISARGADFREARFGEVDASKADFTGADFRGVRASWGTYWSSAKWNGVRCDDGVKP